MYGPDVAILLIYESHDMRHAGFHILMVVNGTSREMGHHTLFLLNGLSQKKLSSFFFFFFPFIFPLNFLCIFFYHQT